MHLASIHSQPENHYIASLMNVHKPIWMVLHDPASECD